MTTRQEMDRTGSTTLCSQRLAQVAGMKHIVVRKTWLVEGSLAAEQGAAAAGVAAGVVVSDAAGNVAVVVAVVELPSSAASLGESFPARSSLPPGLNVRRLAGHSLKAKDDHLQTCVDSSLK